jgi:hypothetical protein
MDQGKVYFDNKTLNEWIALKFNPGISTILYFSTNKGISILKCCQPASAHLKELRLQEEIWESTKGNVTYVDSGGHQTGQEQGGQHPCSQLQGAML